MATVERNHASRLLQWVPVVVLIISAIAGYVRLTEQQMVLDERVTKVEARQEASDQQSVAIRVQLAEIQRDIVYIRQTLEREER